MRISSIVVLFALASTVFIDGLVPFPYADIGASQQLPGALRWSAATSGPNMPASGIARGAIGSGSANPSGGCPSGQVADATQERREGVSNGVLHAPVESEPLPPHADLAGDREAQGGTIPLGSAERALSACRVAEWSIALADTPLVGNGPREALTRVGSNPTPARTGTERSKEATDGMASQLNGSTEVGPDTAISGNVDSNSPGMAVSSDADAAGVRVLGMGPATAGVATYYHPSLAFRDYMRDGVTLYDPQASGVAAAMAYPLGSVVSVRGPSGRSLLLEIRDTGLLRTDPPHLDVSEMDFRVLSGERGLEPGRILVEIRAWPH